MRSFVLFDGEAVVIPNSLTTLDYPRGNLAFRWFLADGVPTRPEARLVTASEAPASVS